MMIDELELYINRKLNLFRWSDIVNENKAVVLGANYYIGLSIIRCLGIHDIPVVAVDYSKKGTYGFYSKYLSEKLIGPDSKEDPEGLLDFFW